MGLVAVRESRKARRPATAQELGDFEADVLARFVSTALSGGHEVALR